MSKANKKRLFFQRLFIWITYLFAGFILYSKKGFLFSFLITFTKIIYPLSIFWLQIRIKRIGKVFPIDSSMSTSQLWFNILPVIASCFAIVFTLLNTLFYIFDKLI